MWWKPFGTGVAPTHKGRMSRKYITRCFQQLWSWKNCSRELQNDSMAKVWETNQEGITKMSPHRGKKCNEKNAMTKMHVHEENGQQQYLLALVECLIDVRLGKNLSVHIRRPAASSYWKSNWSDTCIFELNEPGFSIHSFWVGVTPACKLGTETKNWTCEESPSEQGLPPHTKAVCRENISPVAFSNCDLEKTVPANFKMIPWRKSEKRIRKALQKWAHIEARNVMRKMQWQKCTSMKKTDSNNTYLRWLSAWSTSGWEKTFLYI